ncbi:TetR/AcrR family transcriptional regulator [Streptomyces sp. NBC_00252]|uniref:TetR/AcrR family transcriptional regulator n=1 Tax=Streptomyces sp. NBC_00252 TaxID=2975691 RepID=UPI002E288AEA|nr:TetR/AcrR family transcriptional regulator [Streptomyces sp. NBC_00252]
MSERVRESKDAAELPLRERKKRATRQRISNVASALFRERGFDQVSVAEVARAAEVSTMTVFNYFPRKEDLFLDRIPEAVEVFSAAVRDRAPGETPLAALRRLALELLAQRHPLGGPDSGFPDFWEVVADSPALRARGREALEEMENALAAALTETAPDTPDPALAAALTVAAYRTVYVTTARRVFAGEAAEGLVEDHRARLCAAFDALERALGPA